MKTAELNLLDWQERLGTKTSCAQALAQQRWPQGFRCPALRARPRLCHCHSPFL